MNRYAAPLCQTCNGTGLFEMRANGVPMHSVQCTWCKGLGRSVTARQLDALHTIASGRTDVEAAEHMGVSQHTIKFHIANLMHAFEINSRVGLVVKAIRLGFINLEHVPEQVPYVQHAGRLKRPLAQHAEAQSQSNEVKPNEGEKS